MSARKRRRRWVVDETKAGEAIEFIETYCIHTIGPLRGEPFILEEWQRELVRQAFGTVDGKTGLRRYRTVFLGIPKKNGKSSLSSALALALLFHDREPGAEVYSAAADKDQARITFNPAREMVESSPVLSRLAEVYRNSLYVPSTGSVYRVLSSDVKTKHGPNIHGLLFDELHTQPNRELYDTLTAGDIARRQPMTILMTTAGWDRTSICYEVWDYARKVRDGVLEDETFLPVIYEPEESDGWEDPELWKRVNPNLGVTIPLENFEAKFRKAKAIPGYENTFKRLHLNYWTEQADRWLPMDIWDECAKRISPAKLIGEECVAGLDLSSTTDLTSLVVVFHRRKPKVVMPFFFVPEATVSKRSRAEGVNYEAWVRDGLVEATPGDAVDQSYIRRRLHQIGEEFRIREVAYDPWNATQVVTELKQDGVTMIPCRQGFSSLSPPSKQLERLLLERGLVHGGHPVLRWNAANAAVETDAQENIKPSKARSSDRIDGISALVTALSRVLDLGDGPSSVYEERGMLEV